MNISHESELDQIFNAGFKVGMILGTTMATLVLVALNLLLRSFA